MRKLIVSQKSAQKSLANYKNALKDARKGHLKGDLTELSFDDKREFNRFLKNLGVLTTISIHRPKSIAELAKIMGRGSSRLSSIIRFYEEMGLVKMVSTTSKGKLKNRPALRCERIEVQLN